MQKKLQPTTQKQCIRKELIITTQQLGILNRNDKILINMYQLMQFYPA